MSSRFLDALRDRPLLLDAGMGLRLILAGWLGETEDSSRANLDCPDAVLGFHRDDVRAGSDAILTNTFAANRPSLQKYGRGSDFEAINRVGAALAREAAGPHGFVIGSIGPVADGSESAYREQSQFLIESGVDALILETHDLGSASVALRAITRKSMLPILVSLYRWPDDAAGAARTLLADGASVLGANCGISTADVFMCLDRLAGRVEAPLLAKPGTTLDEGPESFAALVPAFVAMGVRLIGGCCGATADHLVAMRAALDCSSLTPTS